ncbi:MAG: SMP-30/gluconolactonase/LRE family protein [Rhodobacteraceae bacterium]|uniref:SMP-30/gluconolactonase/LRE family protein n=1 Tax=Albidovulum sp. TaxID=1872424 RepID=UPI001DEC2723|nr:SMP-30/gluconolactonase/LRE family protein [uncultured Defluviimonas sp.]MCB2126706.1 SMP-30/gluconolactonase/LRE family protein [Paracoccaceae bacterium]MCC0071217.1 SMP-30/gluconolactonase/LRE family protein [Paracoccaceae bacterium]
MTNTFIWPGGDRFCTAGTTRNAVYRYRLYSFGGALLDRTALQEGHEGGLPDGSCLDADGMIWTARVVGGKCLTRMPPDAEILDVAELDCSWPTSCAFGGSDLDTL